MLIQELKESTQQYPLLGYIVTSNLKGIEVDRSELEQILVSQGYDEKYLPPLTEDRTVLRRSISAWLKANKIKEEGKKQLIREINTKGKKYLGMAVVLELQQLEKLGLYHMTQLRIFMDKETRLLALTTTDKTDTGDIGDIAVSRLTMQPQDEKFLSELEPHFDRFTKLHISGDLSRMVQDIVESMQATSMRQGGGMYFVPYSQRDNLIRLKDLIERRLPAGQGGVNTSYLMAIPIADEPNAKAQVAGISHQALLAEVEALSKDMNRFIEQDTNKPGSVKTNSMTTRLEEYKRMKGKLEFYFDTLGIHQTEVKTRLEELEEQANRLIEAASNAMAQEMDEAQAVS